MVRVSSCFSAMSAEHRIEVALAEVRRFMESRGPKGNKAELLEDMDDLAVFLPFVLWHLWRVPVHDIAGTWLVDRDYGRSKRWVRLCEVWDKRWLRLETGGVAANFLSVWRMACMAEGWRLLDLHYLAGGGLPSIGEICGAAVLWIEERGGPVRDMASIKNKTRREFEKISIGWLVNAAPWNAATSLFPDGFETYLAGVTKQCDPGHDPFSWLPLRDDDVRRAEEARADELEFLRLRHEIPE